MIADIVHSFMRSAPGKTKACIQQLYEALKPSDNKQLFLAFLEADQEQQDFDEEAFRSRAVEIMHSKNANKNYPQTLKRVQEIVFKSIDGFTHAELTTTTYIERINWLLQLRQIEAADYYYKMLKRELLDKGLCTPTEAANIYAMEYRMIFQMKETNLEKKLWAIIEKMEALEGAQQNPEINVLIAYNLAFSSSFLQDMEKLKPKLYGLINWEDRQAPAFSHPDTRLRYCYMRSIVATKWDKDYEEQRYWLEQGLQLLENKVGSNLSAGQWYVVLNEQLLANLSYQKEDQRIQQIIRKVEERLPEFHPEAYNSAVQLLCIGRMNWAFLGSIIKQPLTRPILLELELVKDLYDQHRDQFPFYRRYQVAYQLMGFYFVHASYSDAGHYLSLLEGQMNVTRDKIRRYLRPAMLIYITIQLDNPDPDIIHIEDRLNSLTQRRRKKKWYFSEGEKEIATAFRALTKLIGKPEAQQAVWFELYQQIKPRDKSDKSFYVSDFSTKLFILWLEKRYGFQAPKTSGEPA